MADLSPPVEGMTKIPYGMPLMRDAFLDCSTWALGNEEVFAAFQSDTEGRYAMLGKPATPLERMIDKATGLQDEFCRVWLDWVAVNIWGEEDHEEVH